LGIVLVKEIDKTFARLEEKARPYYGMCGNFIKIGADVFEAVEDEDDGYRSMLADLKLVMNAKTIKEQIFSPLPLSYVTLNAVKTNEDRSGGGDGFEGYEVRDWFIEHVWAVLGTNKTDGYYPSFYVTSHPLTDEQKYKWRDSKEQISMSEFGVFIESLKDLLPISAAAYRRSQKRAATKEQIALQSDLNWGLF
jgi:hypothetical protein